MDRNTASIVMARKIPDVVPYVGTWIEIFFLSSRFTNSGVVPYVGTWIEIR